MKYQTTIILLALSILILADQIDPNYNYTTFCQQFGKNQTEEGRKIFEINYAEYLKNGKSQGRTINQMFDLNPQQKKGFMGRKKNLKLAYSSRPIQSSQLFASPTSFDWRALGRVTAVKDQGGCGSCWAFAGTAQYQSALAIATNGTLYDLAQQYGLECTYQRDGCSGGDELDAVILYNGTGVPLQTLYPYKLQDDYYKSRGINICTNTSTRVKLNVTSSGPVRYQTNTIEQIQADLVQYGPASVGVFASGQFMSTGSNGLVSCTYTDTLDHAILLVGYNSTHWIVKNSWSSSWGHNGFAYLNKTSKISDCGMSTDVVVLKAQYTPPPPPPPPPVVMNVILNITMTDSGNNGWQGNKIAFRQNGVIVGQFGSTFTTGNSSGPISITIDGKKSTQIVASALGTNSSQVGFTIKYPNGTVVFSRLPTTANYTALTIFNTFCAFGGCPTPTINLTITMTDSSGDGWQGTVLAFSQNGAIVGTFGQRFTNNRTSGPIYVVIPGNILTQVVVRTLGDYTNQVGYIIKAPNGTIVASRNRTEFDDKTILNIFCPLGGCAVFPKIKYYITLTSSCSGWGKNVLGLRQNGTIIANLSLTSGNRSSAIRVDLSQFLVAELIVLIYGVNTWEIGFIIRTQSGSVVHERFPGKPFQPNTILYSWTPGRVNTALVYNGQSENKNKVSEETEISVLPVSEKQKSYLTATIIFVTLSAILAIALGISIAKNIKYSKVTLTRGAQIESANTIQKE